MTGHGHFNKHLHIGLVNDPGCRFCGREEETAVHLLTQCPRLLVSRHKHLGSGLLEPEDLRKVPIGSLLAFG